MDCHGNDREVKDNIKREKEIIKIKLSYECITKSNKVIAEELNEIEGNNCNSEKGIGVPIKKIIKTITTHYQEELERDDIDVERILNAPPGRTTGLTPPQLIYDWLWYKKFPRWRGNKIWNIWNNKGKANRSDWLKFKPRSNLTSRPMYIEPENELNLNINYNMQVDINYPDRHLVLLYQGKTACGKSTPRYLLCPSLSYGVESQMLKSNMVFPQSNSNSINSAITFYQEGYEDYLAIVFKDIPLFWIDRLNGKTPVVDDDSIWALWNEIEDKDRHCKFYYQTFNVV